MQTSALSTPPSASLRTREGGSLISPEERQELVAKILARDPKLAQDLFVLTQVCNNENLSVGTGVYTGYPLAGNAPIFTSLGVDFKNTSSVDLFLSREFLEYIMEHGLQIDAVPEARTIFHRFLSNFVQSVQINEASLYNLQLAKEQAQQEGKKLIFLANHISNLDGPIMDYIFTHTLDPLGQKLRFLTGAYMFYSAHVRSFIVGANTTFVYGPSDFGQLVRSILGTYSKKEGMILLQKFQDAVWSSISGNPEEIMLIFPYAGRSQETHGCKKEIPFGMKESLGFKNCMYVPMGFGNIGKIFPQAGGEGNLLRNLAGCTPQDIRVDIGPAFRGGEVDLGQIHERMLDVSKKANSLS